MRKCDCAFMFSCGEDSGTPKVPRAVLAPSQAACLLSRFSRVRLFATLWSIARQVPLSMGLSRQEYWSGFPCPSPGDLPSPGIKPESLMSPALGRRVVYHSRHLRRVIHTWNFCLCHWSQGFGLVIRRRHGLWRVLVCGALFRPGQGSRPSVIAGSEGDCEHGPEGLEEQPQPGAHERAGILAASAWLRGPGLWQLLLLRDSVGEVTHRFLAEGGRDPVQAHLYNCEDGW